jgi:hypothetical protein
VTTPFKATINVDIKYSVPDCDRTRSPGRPRVLRTSCSSCWMMSGFGDGAVGWADRDAEHQPVGGARAHLYELAANPSPRTTPAPAHNSFTGGTFKQVVVDVSGTPYIDLEKEAVAMMSRE